MIITYTGALGMEVTKSHWTIQGWSIPEYGGVPFKPQYTVEPLELPNLDGARYRVGGLHFPRFQMLTVMSASNYAEAVTIAREQESINGDTVSVTPITGGAAYACQVLAVRAYPSARPIVGGLFVPGQQVAGVLGASVDTMWTLQVYQA
jgi:hypothetical protein